MNYKISKHVEALLQPTDDQAWWYKNVKALDAEKAVPHLQNILLNDEESLWNRKTTATILGVLHDKRAIDPLFQVLINPDATLRGRAARALGYFESIEAPVFQRLIQCLDDESSFVRRCSVRALEKLKCVEAIPKLKRMCESDKELTNQEVARKAIKTLQELV